MGTEDPNVMALELARARRDSALTAFVEAVAPGDTRARILAAELRRAFDTAEDALLDRIQAMLHKRIA